MNGSTVLDVRADIAEIQALIPLLGPASDKLIAWASLRVERLEAELQMFALTQCQRALDMAHECSGDTLATVRGRYHAKQEAMLRAVIGSDPPLWRWSTTQTPDGERLDLSVEGCPVALGMVLPDGRNSYIGIPAYPGPIQPFKRGGKGDCRSHVMGVACMGLDGQRLA